MKRPVRASRIQSIWENSGKCFYVHKGKEVYIFDGQLALFWALIDGTRNTADIMRDFPEKITLKRADEILKTFTDLRLITFRGTSI